LWITAARQFSRRPPRSADRSCADASDEGCSRRTPLHRVSRRAAGVHEGAVVMSALFREVALQELHFPACSRASWSYLRRCSWSSAARRSCRPRRGGRCFRRRSLRGRLRERGSGCQGVVRLVYLLVPVRRSSSLATRWRSLCTAWRSCVRLSSSSLSCSFRSAPVSSPAGPRSLNADSTAARCWAPNPALYEGSAATRCSAARPILAKDSSAARRSAARPTRHEDSVAARC